MPSNEETVSIAAALLLSQLNGKQYVLDDKPDFANRTTQDIDYVGHAADGERIAIEHTSVDSFPDQRKQGHADFDL